VEAHTVLSVYQKYHKQGGWFSVVCCATSKRHMPPFKLHRHTTCTACIVTHSTTKYTIPAMFDVLRNVEDSSLPVYEAVFVVYVSEKLAASIYRMIRKENNLCRYT
jgi:hypothetical protein